MSDTYARALGLVGLSIPAHLVADAEVPVLTGPQAQGDLIVVPVEPPDGLAWRPLPPVGVQVVHGEATGNTHWLHSGFGSVGIRWAWADRTGPDSLVVGYLHVPDDQSALLIHTDEHGANGVGPGRYAVRRKREADPTALWEPELWDDRFVED